MNDNLHTLKVVRTFFLIIALIMFSFSIFLMAIFSLIGVKLALPVDDNLLLFSIILLFCIVCITFSFYLDERIKRKENINNWEEFKQTRKQIKRNGTNL